MVNGRTLCFGNISLMGVILSYRDPALMPPGSGFNPTPREIGDEVHAHLLELLRAGAFTLSGKDRNLRRAAGSPRGDGSSRHHRACGGADQLITGPPRVDQQSGRDHLVEFALE